MSKSEKPTITVNPRSDESTWSADDIIAKRLSGEPFGMRTDEIPLKEPGHWQLYIANSQGNESRHYDMVHRKGWKPFTKADLAEGISPESLGFRVAEDNQTLVRGVRGEEVIYKMPKADYDAIQAQKAAANTRDMRSGTAAKQAAAEAAVAAHGPQAAEYLSHANLTITDRRSEE